jgi:hypothetical protein
MPTITKHYETEGEYFYDVELQKKGVVLEDVLSYLRNQCKHVDRDDKDTLYKIINMIYEFLNESTI